nr:S4 domain-containing protein [Marinicella sp. W31]MDC2877768.1 S4 domain-containing protein [Marinicella sp. W31]
MTDTAQRLDQLLVSLNHFKTRSRARDAILRGAVCVNGRTAKKPGEPVQATSRISVSDPASAYVSRAALKLIAALDHFSSRRRAPAHWISAHRQAALARCSWNAAHAM